MEVIWKIYNNLLHVHTSRFCSLTSWWGQFYNPSNTCLRRKEERQRRNDFLINGEIVSINHRSLWVNLRKSHLILNAFCLELSSSRQLSDTITSFSFEVPRAFQCHLLDDHILFIVTSMSRRGVRRVLWPLISFSSHALLPDDWNVVWRRNLGGWWNEKCLIGEWDAFIVGYIVRWRNWSSCWSRTSNAAVQRSINVDRWGTTYRCHDKTSKRGRESLCVCVQMK